MKKMEIISMTINPELLKRVDEKRGSVPRSVFIRDALEAYLK